MQLFQKLFFPLAIIEWSKLDPHLRKSQSFSVFKSNILNLCSYDHLQALFLIVMTLEELLQDLLSSYYKT